MLADFHSSGTLNWLIEAWNTKVKAGEICLAVSLSNLGETWSGPVALCGLRWHKRFCTPSWVIVMSETAGCGLGPKSGKGCKGSSDVNTEVNWLFRMFAFILASLMAVPSLFNGATPHKSVRLLLIKLRSRFGLWFSSIIMSLTYSMYRLAQVLCTTFLKCL